MDYILIRVNHAEINVIWILKMFSQKCHKINMLVYILFTYCISMATCSFNCWKLGLQYVLCQSRKPRLTAMGICCADHATPSNRKCWHLLRLQAAVARSVGIVPLRTKATKFSFFFSMFCDDSNQTFVHCCHL
jgi:hypothetical protein